MIGNQLKERKMTKTDSKQANNLQTDNHSSNTS